MAKKFRGVHTALKKQWRRLSRHQFRELRRITGTAHEEVGVRSQLLVNDRILVAGAIIEGRLGRMGLGRRLIIRLETLDFTSYRVYPAFRT